MPCRPKKKKQKQDAYLQQVSDRKLKGQLKHTERLYKEANKTAARVNQWLAPADAGYIEAEGQLTSFKLCWFTSAARCACYCRQRCSFIT